MNSEIIAALSQLVADEQRDNEALVDTLTRIKAERAQLRLNEVSLAAILFGDDNTTGKGFREMAVRVRELLIVANAAADVCGPFAMLDREGRELIPARDMDRLRAALQPLIVWPSVAAETAAPGELEEVVDWQDDNCGWDGEEDDDDI